MLRSGAGSTLHSTKRHAPSHAADVVKLPVRVAHHHHLAISRRLHLQGSQRGMVQCEESALPVASGGSGGGWG